MSNNNIFESNRIAWNQAMEYHQQARKDSLEVGFENSAFTVFNGEYDHILIAKLNHVDLTGKTIAQLPCNNGQELLSLMRLGAKEAVGFDISDVAISEAKLLADIANLNVNYVRTDILEINDKYNGRFDFIYISEGSLQWFPSLCDYFSVVSRLLKKNGQLLIYEMHPFMFFFDNGFKKLSSYFEKGPYNYVNGLDYLGGVEYESNECFWFMHKMSDIISALLVDFEILEFEEYNFGHTDSKLVKPLGRVPFCFILSGRKK